MHKVLILNENVGPTPTKVLIDGKSLKVKSVDYHADPETVPTFTFEIPSLTCIEVNHANICFRWCSETVEDAVKILQHELLLHGEVYKGFYSSIMSALKDMPSDICLYDAAQMILDRIIDKK